MMNVLKKPLVAYLIAFALVALSTGYLIVFYEEEEMVRENPVEIVDSREEEEIEEINVEAMDGFVIEFKDVTFATLNQLHPVFSDDEEVLWLYGSSGDFSSFIAFHMIETEQFMADEFMPSFFEGMSDTESISELRDIESLEIHFLNQGATYEQVINDRINIVTSYLLMLDDYLILNVLYIHYEGEHTDLRPDFDFILKHIRMDNQDDEESAEINGDLEEGMIAEIRAQIAEKVANYDGDIVIVSNPHAAVAPSLSEFIPIPDVIYNTLGSENGFMDTYMFVEGEIVEWFTYQDFTHLILSNEDGEIQLAILEPLVDNSLSEYQGMLPVGSNGRIYFNYSGFSVNFDRAGGIVIGFVILDEGAISNESLSYSTNMLEDEELLTNLLYYTLSLEFDQLLEMVDAYLEDVDASEDDVAHEIHELALRGAELVEIVDVDIDDFNGQITVYYPGIREISSSVHIVPFIRPEPERVHGRAAPRVRANFDITKGFVRSEWLHFDRTELRMSDGQIVWRNYEASDKSEDVVSEGVREEARRWNFGLFHAVRGSGYTHRFANDMDINYDHVLRFVNRTRDENFDVTLSQAEISALSTIAELFILMAQLTEGIPDEHAP